MIYSTFFGAKALAAGGASLDFLVPEGFVAVLRDVDAFSAGSSGDKLRVWDPDAGVNFIVLTSVGGTTSNQWQGRQVFTEGTTIEATALTGSWQVRLSGYLLTP